LAAVMQATGPGASQVPRPEVTEITNPRNPEALRAVPPGQRGREGRSSGENGVERLGVVESCSQPGGPTSPLARHVGEIAPPNRAHQPKLGQQPPGAVRTSRRDTE